MATSQSIQLLTPPQCALLKNFKIATLYPDGEGQVQIIPAHYDTFSPEAICGKRKIGMIPPIFFQQNNLNCEECEQQDCLCLLTSSTLILDTPVCRDGSIQDRARYTIRWPLVVTKSKIQIGKDGIFTRAELPPRLLFGPFEGVYKGEQVPFHSSQAEYSDIVQLLNDFIDSSDSSLSNWLSFVATTTLRHLANCIPVLYKGSIFYKTITTISKETELLVWTGQKVIRKQTSLDNSKTNRDAGAGILDSSLQCSWCRLQFLDTFYLQDHERRCSAKSSQGEIQNCSLRRSKRMGVKSVRSYSLLSPPPSPKRRNVAVKTLSDRLEQSAGKLNRLHDLTGSFGMSCSYCGLVCEDKKSLDQHVEDQHYSQTLGHYCTSDFPNDSSPEHNKREPFSPILVEKNYNYHLGNDTCVFDLPWVKTLLRMNKAIRQNKSSPLRCSFCHMQFYNHFGAAIHEHACMDGRRPYKCGHCGKRFQLYFSIVKHMIRHEDAEKEILATLARNCQIGDVYTLTENLNNSKIANFVGISSAPVAIVPSHQEFGSDPQSLGAPDQNPCVDDDDSLSSVSRGMILQSDVMRKDEVTNVHSTFNNEKHLDKENDHFTVNSMMQPVTVDLSLDTARFLTKIDVSDSIYCGRRRKHECSICGQKFYRRKHIKKHMELHENETSKVYKCFYCNLWFGCSDIVTYHVQSSHDSEMKQKVISGSLTSEQSFLKKILTVLAKEGTKGRYSDYLNAKGTIKDKKFECEICSKKFTSFYRVRKHKIVSHSELLDLLEKANDLIVLPEEHLKESNILTLLSSIKEESVENSIPGNCEENATFPSREHVSQIQLTLKDNKDSCTNSDSVIFHEENSPVNLLVEDTSSEAPQTSSSKTAHIYLAKNVLHGQPTVDKLILPKSGVEFEQVGSATPGTPSTDETEGKLENGGHYFFIQKDNVKLLSETPFTERKIDLKKVIQQTFSSVSLKSMTVKKRYVRGEIMKQCKVCGKKLSLKTNMKGHLRSHTGERHYECQYCHKRYALLSTLKRHIRIHTGYRPFKCDMCDRTYTQSSNLKRHRRQHTGERPFRCSFCPRRYAEKFSLNRHLKKHKQGRECTLSGVLARSTS